MTKKLTVLAIIVALGIGGASTVAYQIHAQQPDTPVTPAVSQSQAITAPIASTQSGAQIQNKAEQADGETNDDQGAVNKSDTGNKNETADKETNDDQASSTIKKADGQEQGESTASDANEKEDAN